MSAKNAVNSAVISIVMAIITFVSTLYVVKARSEDYFKRTEQLEIKCDNISGVQADLLWMKQFLREIKQDVKEVKHDIAKIKK